MDLHALQKRQAFRPAAPSTITKEHQGIWDAWTFKSDREVVREAAAKGHVSLAIQFLSVRKNIQKEQTQDFVNGEVFKWVAELLDRKQIFRVSHILTNVGIDPGPELITVFCDTEKKYLRDYIGDYLTKTSQLIPELQDLWYFLELILTSNIVTTGDKLRQHSIRWLQEKPNIWKHETAGKLFLATKDPRLVSFLDAECLWKMLFYHNNVKSLKMWINISFAHDQPQTILSDGLLKVFKALPITDIMINNVLIYECLPETQEDILNEFCKLGKFANQELCSVINVLYRINQSGNILNIYNILSQQSSNLSINFFSELFVTYCSNNNLLTVLNHCADRLDVSELAKDTFFNLSLILDMRNLVPYFSGPNLCDNIINVAKYLNRSSLSEYFCDNPILFFSLIMFSQNLSVITAIKDKSLNIQDAVLYETLMQILNTCRLTKNIYKKHMQEITTNMTYYDLAVKHLNVDIKNIYHLFRENESFPTYNSFYLFQKYGYQKKINYMFYIKECMPSLAYKKIVNLGQQDNVTRKATKLGILNLGSPAKVAALVAFFEMANFNSEFLRICFKSMNLLKEAGIDPNLIMAMFLKVNDDPLTVLNILETVVVKQLDFNNLMIGSIFLNVINLYDVVFRFCVLSKLPLPEMFLKQCAGLNLWLPFVLYAQIKNYPIAQIKALVPNFKNPNMVEHIVHSVMHDIQLEDVDILRGERNARIYYLSRIGVRPRRENLNSENLSYSNISMASSQGSSIESLEIDVSNVKTTLLQTLIRCHNSTDPPGALLQACQLYKYPFLAIVATCYEPDSAITHWIAWLSVSTDMYEIFTSFEALTISGVEVAKFLIKCMENRYPRTLLESFIIFIPDNPLRYFMEFLNLAIFKKHDKSLLKSTLEIFLKTKNQRRGSIFSEKDYEMMYLKNKMWIETTSLELLAASLVYNVDSIFEQEEFMDILNELDFKKYFDYDTPDFDFILRVLKLASKVNINFNIGELFNTENSVEAYHKCIDALTKADFFEDALNLAHFAKIKIDSILQEMWEHRLTFEFQMNRSLINRCDQDFKVHSIPPEKVVTFYRERLVFAKTAADKYHLYRLAHKWSKLNNLPDQYEMEIQMILMFIFLDECETRISELTELDKDFNAVTIQEIIQDMDKLKVCSHILSNEVITKLDLLLNIALDKNNFWLALKLEKIFSCKSFDLTILKTCHKLAEKIITPDHLEKEHKHWLLQANLLSSYERKQENGIECNAHIFNSDSAASQRQILSMIHCLVDKLEHGTKLGLRIMRTYRMSINIDVPYYVIVTETDPFKIVKIALCEDCLNKLEVVHDFILSFQPSLEEIADLLSQEIITASSEYVKSKTDKFVMWDLNMNTQFHLILQLIKSDCSILGYKLYNYASVLYRAQLPNEFDFRISELALVVELLIAAHHCFTADCNMDGISIILRKNRSLISHLLNLRSWKLIVRLFIGIGRFSEMNYVFHILKEHDQFEYLLRKGSRKDDSLKESILEYIRRFCPDNANLYEMVALHFLLYSEVAELWEKESEHLIKDLMAIAKLEMENDGLNVENEPFILLSSSAGTEKYLDKVLENYTHATEFHMRGDKLSKAMNSVKKGELIALQKSLFKSTGNNTNGCLVKATCLLNLSFSQITALISRELNFSQSYLLVQAYNFFPDWASIIYEQCIKQNNFTYLKEYMNLLPFNESLVQDISRKFINANNNDPISIQNMKHIVSMLVSVHAQYIIASELGFTDLVEDLLDKSQLVYLKDTVWKTGYRGSS